MIYLIKQTKRVSSSAFTLIESLIVIAIIATLAAILIPTLGNMGDSARSTQSLSNLRQTASAMFLYTQDNSGVMPPGWFDDDNDPKMVWQDRLAPYVGLQGGRDRVSPINVLNSPYQEIKNPGPNWWENGRSFGLNVYAYEKHDSNQWKRRILVVPKLNQTILVGDMVQGENDFVGPPGGANPNNARHPAFRHNKGKIAHFAFCDGSVRGLTVAELDRNPTNTPNLWRWW